MGGEAQVTACGRKSERGADCSGSRTLSMPKGRRHDPGRSVGAHEMGQGGGATISQGFPRPQARAFFPDVPLYRCQGLLEGGIDRPERGPGLVSTESESPAALSLRHSHKCTRAAAVCGRLSLGMGSRSPVQKSLSHKMFRGSSGRGKRSPVLERRSPSSKSRSSGLGKASPVLERRSPSSKSHSSGLGKASPVLKSRSPRR